MGEKCEYCKISRRMREAEQNHEDKEALKFAEHCIECKHLELPPVGAFAMRAIKKKYPNFATKDLFEHV